MQNALTYSVNVTFAMVLCIKLLHIQKPSTIGIFIVCGIKTKQFNHCCYSLVCGKDHIMHTLNKSQ